MTCRVRDEDGSATRRLHPEQWLGFLLGLLLILVFFLVLLILLG